MCCNKELIRYVITKLTFLPFSIYFSLYFSNISVSWSMTCLWILSTYSGSGMSFFSTSMGLPTVRIVQNYFTVMNVIVYWRLTYQLARYACAAAEIQRYTGRNHAPKQSKARYRLVSWLKFESVAKMSWVDYWLGQISPLRRRRMSVQ